MDRSRSRRPASASGRWCRRTTRPSAAGWRCGRRRSRRRSGPCTGARPSANSTVTPSAVSVQFSIRWPHRTSTLSKRSRPMQQFGVHHRLDEAVAFGPAETRVRRRHLREQFPLRVEEPQDLVGHGMRQHLLHQPDRLKCPQRLVVQPDAARIVDEAVPLVDHQRPNTLQPKDVGQGEPDRAAPTMTMSTVFAVSHVSAPAGSPDGAG